MAHDPLVLQMHNHAHGRVFVLGSGPSLLTQKHLLPRLKHEATFTCNSVPRWTDLPFTPTYHGISDIMKSKAAKGFSYAELGPQMYRFNVAWPEWEHATDAFTYVEKAHDNIQVFAHGTVGMGADLPPIPTARTTPFTLVQLALWFGYEEVYMLGVDMSRGYVDKPDAKVGNSGMKFLADNNPKFIMAIQRCAVRMRSEMEAEGRKLVDCTPGGFLNPSAIKQRRGLRWVDVLPYAPLDDVLATHAGRYA